MSKRPQEDQVFGKHRLPASAMSLVLQVEPEYWELRFSRSRFRRIEEDYDILSRRTLKAQLLVDGDLAGSFLFHEYRFAPLLGSDELMDCADNYSSSLVDLMHAICEAWPEPFEVVDYGTVVELERAWMAPKHSRSRRFEQAVGTLTELFSDRALLMLKAFPLEYEGDLNAGNHGAFTRRQAAMMRHYRSTMGVERLPGTAGDEGWMFALRPDLAEVVRPPQS